MVLLQILVRFIVGVVWAFLLTGIVSALMLVVTKRRRPTLSLETSDICMKTALFGVFPYFFAFISHSFLMGTAIYAASTFIVAVSLTAIRTMKPPKQRFEEDLARERESQAMMKLCGEAIRFVNEPDDNVALQATRCDLLRSMWANLNAEQRKVVPLMARGNTSRDIAVKLNIDGRRLTLSREAIFHKLGVRYSSELVMIVAAIKACGIDVDS
jgi:DNA-binding CsgD family transcriptional regulator